MMLDRQFAVIRKFIEEEGQEKGEVSGQMALLAVQIIEEALGKVERIEVARFLPGDLLIVTMRDHRRLSDLDYQRFKEAWRAVLPVWVKVVVAEGCDVTVVRPEDGGTKSEAD